MDTNDEIILSFLVEAEAEFVSGSALSDKLQLSRTAVWKHVENLRGAGYRIEAQAAKGYRLVEIPDRLTSMEIGPFLNTRDLGRTIHHFDSLASTNETAFTMAREGATHGEVVIAENQTSGKGRRGRSWFSPVGKNLALSVVLRPEISPTRVAEITLVAAVATVRALLECEVKATIKWPNDILVQGKKVAGILTELSADVEAVHFVVLGIGINLNSTLDDFPDDVKPIAISARMARAEPLHRALFVSKLLESLELALDEWTNFGFEPIREAWKTHSEMLGTLVRVVNDGKQIIGIAEDIDAQGALILNVNGVRQVILSGDVEQVRSAPTQTQ
jgi:BirA family transcriptional regulator, biotin operon repressor / biotin---[acetyl-CoA-carboxylase] ligase